LGYIIVLFLITGVMGIGGLTKRTVNYYKRKKEDEAEKQKKEKLLHDLEHLRPPERGFKTREDCVAWANKAAPLLRFNLIYYGIFMENFGIIPLKLSSLALGPAVTNMKNQVIMAIEELKHDLKNEK